MDQSMVNSMLQSLLAWEHDTLTSPNQHWLTPSSISIGSSALAHPSSVPTFLDSFPTLSKRQFDFHFSDSPPGIWPIISSASQTLGNFSFLSICLALWENKLPTPGHLLLCLPGYASLLGSEPRLHEHHWPLCPHFTLLASLKLLLPLSHSHLCTHLIRHPSNTFSEAGIHGKPQ